MAMERKLLIAVSAFILLAMFARFGGMAQAVKLDVSSTAFEDGGRIPVKYTCSGEDVSPDLQWSRGPPATESYALVVDDPDAPGGPFTHWTIFNIPANVTRLTEGVAASGRLDDGSTQGKNHFGRIGYGGPCPPAGKPHHYHINVYALDTRLRLGPGVSKDDLLKAMNGHILAQGELIGIYGR